MFEEDFFRLIQHPDQRAMRVLQQRVAARVSREFDEVRKLYGVDVAYKGKNAVGAIASEDYENYTIKKVRFPYIPTYFAFRELPVLWVLVKKCDGCIIFDGNGMLHPYHAGLATMAGVILEKQTIGMAKSLLCGTLSGDHILLNGEVIGAVVHSSERPIYVSVGNKITVEQAVQTVSDNCHHRVPEVVRKAHMLANRIAKRI
ncbi:MAG: endonuclease V [Euryarchaeota archaeon]|nr:endonuclease V [Euryarchaeota archaeon]